MNALRILGFLGLAAALIAALIYRLLAFRHRSPGSSFLRAMLEGVGFTEAGARYLRRQYIAMAVAFALVLLLLAIWPRPDAWYGLRSNVSLQLTGARSMHMRAR